MKGAPIPALMWLVVILVHAYLSIADPAKTNDTISVCDGSVQDCLIGGHLEPEFPTITSSHFGRMLAVNDGKKTTPTSNPSKPVCKNADDRYHDCFPLKGPDNADHCKEVFNRGCK